MDHISPQKKKANKSKPGAPVQVEIHLVRGLEKYGQSLLFRDPRFFDQGLYLRVCDGKDAKAKVRQAENRFLRLKKQRAEHPVEFYKYAGQYLSHIPTHPDIRKDWESNYKSKLESYLPKSLGGLEEEYSEDAVGIDDTPPPSPFTTPGSVSSSRFGTPATTPQSVVKTPPSTRKVTFEGGPPLLPEDLTTPTKPASKQGRSPNDTRAKLIERRRSSLPPDFTPPQARSFAPRTPHPIPAVTDDEATVMSGMESSAIVPSAGATPRNRGSKWTVRAAGSLLPYTPLTKAVAQSMPQTWHHVIPMMVSVLLDFRISSLICLASHFYCQFTDRHRLYVFQPGEPFVIYGLRIIFAAGQTRVDPTNPNNARGFDKIVMELSLIDKEDWKNKLIKANIEGQCIVIYGPLLSASQAGENKIQLFDPDTECEAIRVYANKQANDFTQLVKDKGDYEWTITVDFSLAIPDGKHLSNELFNEKVARRGTTQTKTKLHAKLVPVNGQTKTSREFSSPGQNQDPIVIQKTAVMYFIQFRAIIIQFHDEEQEESDQSDEEELAEQNAARLKARQRGIR